MKPKFIEGNVRSDCPDCGVPSTFEFREPSGTKEFGTIVIEGEHYFDGDSYQRILYKFLRCTVCHRPAVATLHANDEFIYAALESFWPAGIQNESIPVGVPYYIKRELRESELCINARAWRAAAAVLRSTLEKTLIANGYHEKKLYQKIDSAGDDGIISVARRQRVHEVLKTLGKDVLNGEWREVTREEVEAAHKYVARIIVDFYDDRDTVIRVLTKKKRAIASD